MLYRRPVHLKANSGLQQRISKCFLLEARTSSGKEAERAITLGQHALSDTRRAGGERSWAHTPSPRYHLPVNSAPLMSLRTPLRELMRGGHRVEKQNTPDLGRGRFVILKIGAILLS